MARRTPLRKLLAVVLSLSLLPWQPLAAWADDAPRQKARDAVISDALNALDDEIKKGLQTPAKKLPDPAGLISRLQQVKTDAAVALETAPAKSSAHEDLVGDVAEADVLARIVAIQPALESMEAHLSAYLTAPAGGDSREAFLQRRKALADIEAEWAALQTRFDDLRTTFTSPPPEIMEASVTGVIMPLATAYVDWRDRLYDSYQKTRGRAGEDPVSAAADQLIGGELAAALPSGALRDLRAQLIELLKRNASADELLGSIKSSLNKSNVQGLSYDRALASVNQRIQELQARSTRDRSRAAPSPSPAQPERGLRTSAVPDAPAPAANREAQQNLAAWKAFNADRLAAAGDASAMTDRLGRLKDKISALLSGRGAIADEVDYGFRAEEVTKDAEAFRGKLDARWSESSTQARRLDEYIRELDRLTRDPKFNQYRYGGFVTSELGADLSLRLKPLVDDLVRQSSLSDFSKQPSASDYQEAWTLVATYRRIGNSLSFESRRPFEDLVAKLAAAQLEHMKTIGAALGAPKAGDEIVLQRVSAAEAAALRDQIEAGSPESRADQRFAAFVDALAAEQRRFESLSSELPRLVRDLYELMYAPGDKATWPDRMQRFLDERWEVWQAARSRLLADHAAALERPFRDWKAHQNWADGFPMAGLFSGLIEKILGPRKGNPEDLAAIARAFLRERRNLAEMGDAERADYVGGTPDSGYLGKTIAERAVRREDFARLGRDLGDFSRRLDGLSGGELAQALSDFFDQNPALKRNPDLYPRAKDWIALYNRQASDPAAAESLARETREFKNSFKLGAAETKTLLESPSDFVSYDLRDSFRGFSDKAYTYLKARRAELAGSPQAVRAINEFIEDYEYRGTIPDGDAFGWDMNVAQRAKKALDALPEEEARRERDRLQAELGKDTADLSISHIRELQRQRELLTAKREREEPDPARRSQAALEARRTEIDASLAEFEARDLRHGAIEHAVAALGQADSVDGLARVEAALREDPALFEKLAGAFGKDRERGAQWTAFLRAQVPVLRRESADAAAANADGAGRRSNLQAERAEVDGQIRERTEQVKRIDADLARIYATRAAILTRDADHPVSADSADARGLNPGTALDRNLGQLERSSRLYWVQLALARGDIPPEKARPVLERALTGYFGDANDIRSSELAELREPSKALAAVTRMFSAEALRSGHVGWNAEKRRIAEQTARSPMAARLRSVFGSLDALERFCDRPSEADLPSDEVLTRLAPYFGWRAAEGRQPDIGEFRSNLREAARRGVSDRSTADYLAALKARSARWRGGPLADMIAGQPLLLCLPDLAERLNAADPDHRRFAKTAADLAETLAFRYDVALLQSAESQQRAGFEDLLQKAAGTDEVAARMRGDQDRVAQLNGKIDGLVADPQRRRAWDALQDARSSLVTAVAPRVFETPYLLPSGRLFEGWTFGRDESRGAIRELQDWTPAATSRQTFDAARADTVRVYSGASERYYTDTQAWGGLTRISSQEKDGSQEYDLVRVLRLPTAPGSSATLAFTQLRRDGRLLSQTLQKADGAGFIRTDFEHHREFEVSGDRAVLSSLDDENRQPRGPPETLSPNPNGDFSKVWSEGRYVHGRFIVETQNELRVLSDGEGPLVWDDRTGRRVHAQARDPRDGAAGWSLPGDAGDRRRERWALELKQRRDQGSGVWSSSAFQVDRNVDLADVPSDASHWVERDRFAADSPGRYTIDSDDRFFRDQNDQALAGDRQQAAARASLLRLHDLLANGRADDQAATFFALTEDFLKPSDRNNPSAEYRVQKLEFKISASLNAGRPDVDIDSTETRVFGDNEALAVRRLAQYRHAGSEDELGKSLKAMNLQSALFIGRFEGDAYQGLSSLRYLDGGGRLAEARSSLATDVATRPEWGSYFDPVPSDIKTRVTATRRFRLPDGRIVEIEPVVIEEFSAMNDAAEVCGERMARLARLFTSDEKTIAVMQGFGKAIPGTLRMYVSMAVTGGVMEGLGAAGKFFSAVKGETAFASGARVVGQTLELGVAGLHAKFMVDMFKDLPEAVEKFEDAVRTIRAETGDTEESRRRIADAVKQATDSATNFAMLFDMLAKRGHEPERSRDRELEEQGPIRIGPEKKADVENAPAKPRESAPERRPVERPAGERPIDTPPRAPENTPRPTDRPAPPAPERLPAPPAPAPRSPGGIPMPFASDAPSGVEPVRASAVNPISAPALQAPAPASAAASPSGAGGGNSFFGLGGGRPRPEAPAAPGGFARLARAVEYGVTSVNRGLAGGLEGLAKHVDSEASGARKAVFGEAPDRGGPGSRPAEPPPTWLGDQLRGIAAPLKQQGVDAPGSREDIAAPQLRQRADFQDAAAAALGGGENGRVFATVDKNGNVKEVGKSEPGRPREGDAVVALEVRRDRNGDPSIRAMEQVAGKGLSGEAAARLAARDGGMREHYEARQKAAADALPRAQADAARDRADFLSLKADEAERRSAPDARRVRREADAARKNADALEKAADARDAALRDRMATAQRLAADRRGRAAEKGRAAGLAARVDAYHRALDSSADAALAQRRARRAAAAADVAASLREGARRLETRAADAEERFVQTARELRASERQVSSARAEAEAIVRYERAAAALEDARSAGAKAQELAESDRAAKEAAGEAFRAMRDAEQAGVSDGIREAVIERARAIELLDAARGDAAAAEHAARAAALEGALDERLGLSRSAGYFGDAGLAVQRRKADAGRLELGREVEHQGDGRYYCVLASIADRAGITIAKVEAAIDSVKGPEAGARLRADIARRGMTAAEMEAEIPSIAAELGFNVRKIQRGSVFSELAKGRTVQVILNDGSGAHMVNVSNLRLLKSAETGRMEMHVDVADTAHRVGGASRAAAWRVEDLVPMLRGKFIGEGTVSGLVFEKAPGVRSAPAPIRLPLERAPAGVGAAEGRVPAERRLSVVDAEGHEVALAPEERARQTERLDRCLDLMERFLKDRGLWKDNVPEAFDAVKYEVNPGVAAKGAAAEHQAGTILINRYVWESAPIADMAPTLLHELFHNVAGGHELAPHIIEADFHLYLKEHPGLAPDMNARPGFLSERANAWSRPGNPFMRLARAIIGESGGAIHAEGLAKSDAAYRSGALEDFIRARTSDTAMDRVGRSDVAALRRKLADAPEVKAKNESRAQELDAEIGRLRAEGARYGKLEPLRKELDAAREAARQAATDMRQLPMRIELIERYQRRFQGGRETGVGAAEGGIAESLDHLTRLSPEYKTRLGELREELAQEVVLRKKKAARAADPDFKGRVSLDKAEHEAVDRAAAERFAETDLGRDIVRTRAALNEAVARRLGAGADELVLFHGIKDLAAVESGDGLRVSSPERSHFGGRALYMTSAFDYATGYASGKGLAGESGAKDPAVATLKVKRSQVREIDALAAGKEAMRRLAERGVKGGRESPEYPKELSRVVMELSGDAPVVRLKNAQGERLGFDEVIVRDPALLEGSARLVDADTLEPLGRELKIDRKSFESNIPRAERAPPVDSGEAGVGAAEAPLAERKAADPHVASDVAAFRYHLEEGIGLKPGVKIHPESGEFYRGVGRAELERIIRQGGLVPQIYQAKEGRKAPLTPLTDELERSGIGMLIVRHTQGETPNLTGVTSDRRVAEGYVGKGAGALLRVKTDLAFSSREFSAFTERDARIKRSEAELLIPGVVTADRIEVFEAGDKWRSLATPEGRALAERLLGGASSAGEAGVGAAETPRPSALHDAREVAELPESLLTIKGLKRLDRRGKALEISRAQLEQAFAQNPRALDGFDLADGAVIKIGGKPHEAEAQAAAAAVPHPDDIKVPGVIAEGPFPNEPGVRILVMEKARGSGLDEFIARRSRLDRPISRAEWSALEGYVRELNARGVSHGDFNNPENVHVSVDPATGRREFTVIDFGEGGVERGGRPAAGDDAGLSSLRRQLAAAGLLEEAGVGGAEDAERGFDRRLELDGERETPPLPLEKPILIDAGPRRLRLYFDGEGREGAGVYLEDPADGRVSRRLRPGETFTVGRDPSCGFQVADPYVSRRQLAIRIESGRAVIEDAGSASGTRVRSEDPDRQPATLDGSLFPTVLERVAVLFTSTTLFWGLARATLDFEPFGDLAYWTREFRNYFRPAPSDLVAESLRLHAEEAPRMEAARAKAEAEAAARADAYAREAFARYDNESRYPLVSRDGKVVTKEDNLAEMKKDYIEATGFRAANAQRLVVGAFDDVRARQRQGQEGDCAIRTIYNLPDAEPIRAVFPRYEDFRELFEKMATRVPRDTIAPLSRLGTPDWVAAEVLEQMGFRMTAREVNVGEQDLLDRLRWSEGNVYASILWRHKGTFGLASHAVMLTGALKTRGVWKFVMVDPHFGQPRLYTHADLARLQVGVYGITPRFSKAQIAATLEGLKLEHARDKIHGPLVYDPPRGPIARFMRRLFGPPQPAAPNPDAPANPAAPGGVKRLVIGSGRGLGYASAGLRPGDVTIDLSIWQYPLRDLGPQDFQAWPRELELATRLPGAREFKTDKGEFREFFAVQRSRPARWLSRLLGGDGRAWRIVEPGTSGATRFVQERVAPDVAADLNRVPMRSDAFEEVYFEKVPYDAFTGANRGGVAETVRVLKPGGRMIIETGRMAPRAEIEASLRAAGLRVIEASDDVRIVAEKPARSDLSSQSRLEGPPIR